MPDVRPFRAWRYDTAVAGPLDSLICPPYDVIDPAAAQRLLDRNPHNVIHLELGPGSTDPTAPDNRYARAAATLDRWIAAGVIRTDETPCLYVYEQRFRLDGEGRRRTSFFAAVRLTPWASGDVLPHEATLAAPKADRLALLEATRTNVSPIHALCDSALPGVAALLGSATQRAADAEATDADGERHRLWAVADPAAIAGVTHDLAARRLYIADGHHRYETALAFAKMLGGAGASGGAGYVLMAITPVDDPGLIVLATHRLLRNFDARRLDAALARLDEVFDVDVVEHVPPAAGKHAIGLYTPGLARLLRPRPGAGASRPLNAALHAVDAALVQALLFEQLLGLTPEDLRRQSNVDYTRDVDEALRLVDGGSYQAAVLLYGTPPATVLAVARAGAQMPQKSTYFYPKLATGLVLRRVGSRQ